MLRSLGWQTISVVYVAVLSAVLVFMLGRLLGPERFGEYNVLLTVIAILGIFIDGGFRNLIQRETAVPTPDLGIAPNDLLVSAIGYALLLTNLLVLASALIPQKFNFSMQWALGVIGAMVIIQYYAASLRGRGEFKAEARWQMFQRSLTLICTLLGAYLWGSTLAAFCGWFVGACSALVLILFSKNSIVLKFPHIQFSVWWRICAPFLIIDLATAVYFRIDIVMLDRLMESPMITGNYAAAYRLLEVVILLFNPFSVVVFRKLRLLQDEHSHFRSLLLVYGGAAFFVAVALCGIVFLIGGNFVILIYGFAYNEASKIFPWLMVSAIFLLPNGMLTLASIAQNLEWRYAYAALFAALVNVILNFVWIPKYGAFGAALATAVTECVLMFELLWVLRNWLKKE